MFEIDPLISRYERFRFFDPLAWCRAELWCHLLSTKPFTEVIVVFSAKEAQFMYPTDWQEKTIDSGDFTVESDREVVMKLGEVAVEHKVQNLLLQGNLRQYRWFLAHRPMMLGQAALTWEPQGFLEHFQFKDLSSAVQDGSSMSALLCATFAGDVNMVRLLVEQKADVNYRTHGLEDLGYTDDLTLLIVALRSGQGREMISALLEMACDVNVETKYCVNASTVVRSPEHIELLLAARADFHSPVGYLGLLGAEMSL